MGKVEVSRSIGRAYGFGFGHFGTALAICWLPYVLMAAAGFFLFAPAIVNLLQDVSHLLTQQLDTLSNEQREEQIKQVFTAYAGFFWRLALFGIIWLFLRAMVAVGLTRASVGLEEHGFFYFSLGAPVWKLFGAWIATFLIIYAAKAVLILVAAVIGVIVFFALYNVSLVTAIGVCALLYIAVLFAILYISVRLNFFLPPVVVSEKKLDLLRSWTLSEGNFWRIVVIYVIIILPFLVIALAFDASLLIALFPYLHALQNNLPVSKMPDWSVLAQQFHFLLPWLPAYVAVAFLAQVLFSAMQYAARARAYRGLVSTDIASQTED